MIDNYSQLRLSTSGHLCFCLLLVSFSASGPPARPHSALDPSVNGTAFSAVILTHFLSERNRARLSVILNYLFRAALWRRHLLTSSPGNHQTAAANPSSESQKGQVILISLYKRVPYRQTCRLWSARTIWGHFGTHNQIFLTPGEGVLKVRWRQDGGAGASRRAAVRKRRAGEETALERLNCTAARRAASTGCSATHRAPLSISAAQIQDSSRW